MVLDAVLAIVMIVVVKLKVIFLLYHIKTQFMMKILARSQTTGTIDSLATRDGPSCPPMSKMAWSQLSTLGKLDGTSCQP